MYSCRRRYRSHLHILRLLSCALRLLDCSFSWRWNVILHQLLIYFSLQRLMLKRLSWCLATEWSPPLSEGGNLHAAHLLSDLVQSYARGDQSFAVLYLSQSEPVMVLSGILLRSHPLQLMPRSALPGYLPPTGGSTAQVWRLSASRTSHLDCPALQRRCFRLVDIPDVLIIVDIPPH